MRRGLINWDAGELPLAALHARTQRLRDAMAGAHCDAIILYTNFIRCAAVAWMTGFSPYWADGILVVPREGELLFATTLSKRMGSWIQTVMPNATVATSPDPGRLAGKRLVEAGARRIGILELGGFPAGLYTDLAAALPAAQLIEAADIFAMARFPADDTERKLLKRSDEIAAAALYTLEGAGPETVGEGVALVEKSARMDGAEEIYVALAPDLDLSKTFLRLSGPRPLGARFAVRATVAYKGSWVRRIRSFSRDADELRALRQIDSSYGNLLGNIQEFPTDREIAQHVAQIADARLDDWFAEAPAGTRPLNIVPNGRSMPIVLTMSLNVAGRPWCGAGLATLMS